MDLTLELASPNWKLERGKLYPVKLTLGPVSFDEQVAAEPSSVSLDVKDKKFAAALRSASALNVVGAGATIRVPLDKSTAAFDRLEQCVDQERKGGRNKPFCGTGTSAVKAGVPEGKAQGCTVTTAADGASPLGRP